MNNQFVKSYCEFHGLKILPSKVKGENFITFLGEKIGFFRADSKYVQFDREYKKSDLMQFLLENINIHKIGDQDVQ
jgi:hypothetical protein